MLPGAAMDGDFPPHDPPPAGNILYSAPPLCGASGQVSVRGCVLGAQVGSRLVGGVCASVPLLKHFFPGGVTSDDSYNLSIFFLGGVSYLVMFLALNSGTPPSWTQRTLWDARD